MHVEKIVMNDAQKAIFAEIDAIVTPLQAEIDAYQEDIANSIPSEIVDIKVKIRANKAKIVPLAMIKAGVVSPRSRAKYFNEFYSLTPEDVDPLTAEGQSKLAQFGVIKDDDATIDRFIESVRPLIQG